MRPVSENDPTRVFELLPRLEIALDVAGDLGTPIVDVGLWLPVVGSTAMPETAIYEHGDASSRKQDVGCAADVRERSRSDAVSKASGV